jgi:hypothetical protein
MLCRLLRVTKRKIWNLLRITIKRPHIGTAALKKFLNEIDWMHAVLKATKSYSSVANLREKLDEQIN